MGRKGYVYILASQKNGTLDTGVTSDLAAAFSSTRVGSARSLPPAMAIAREKAIKKWPRACKVKLIKDHNPDWRDISWHLM